MRSAVRTQLTTSVSCIELWTSIQVALYSVWSCSSSDVPTSCLGSSCLIWLSRDTGYAWGHRSVPKQKGVIQVHPGHRYPSRETLLLYYMAVNIFWWVIYDFPCPQCALFILLRVRNHSSYFNPTPVIWIGEHVNPSKKCRITLQWRRNELDGVSNHQPYECLLSRLFRRRWKKTSKLRVTSLCEGNSPATGEFSAQRASNAENVSIGWRHHGQLHHHSSNVSGPKGI